MSKIDDYFRTARPQHCSVQINGRPSTENRRRSSVVGRLPLAPRVRWAVGAQLTAEGGPAAVDDEGVARDPGRIV